MTNPTLWNQILVWPITNLLVVFYKFAEWLHLPGPLGFSIIFLTIAIRLILYPVMHAQLKSAKKMNDIKPHLDALNAKHKDNKQALQQAQLDLYKEHGINPASGCLPLLIQFPILIALYNVFFQLLGSSNIAKFTSDINAVLYSPALRLHAIDFSFFGINLGAKPSEFQKYGLWLLLVPVITGGLQWYQTKIMTASSPKAAPVTPEVKPDTKKKKGTAEAKTVNEAPPVNDAAEMQKQMAIIMPVMFGFFSWQLPIGLALYWNIFGLFGIMQQLNVNRAK